MRMFQRARASVETQPLYCCQSDGMIGLGCGARSYTTSLHYATEYAVGRPGVLDIIDDYSNQPASSFDTVRFGFRLSDEELVSLEQVVVPNTFSR